VSKTIEIVVGPKGETTVQTRGFSGAECRDASRSLEQALGTRTVEQLTAEFYQGQQARQDLRQSHSSSPASPTPDPSLPRITIEWRSG
jgi:hypothetical protein